MTQLTGTYVMLSPTPYVAFRLAGEAQATLSRMTVNGDGSVTLSTVDTFLSLSDAVTAGQWQAQRDA